MESNIQRSWLTRFEQPRKSVIIAIYLVPSLLILLDIIFFTGIDVEKNNFGLAGQYSLYDALLGVLIFSVAFLVGIMRLTNYMNVNYHVLFNIVFLFLVAGVGLVVIPQSINVFWAILTPIGFLAVMHYGKWAIVGVMGYTVLLEFLFYLLKGDFVDTTSYYFALPVMLFASLVVANAFNESIIDHYEENKDSKKRLKNEYQKTTQLINSINDAAVNLDKDMNISVYNMAFSDLIEEGHVNTETHIDDTLKLRNDDGHLIKASSIIKKNSPRTLLKFKSPVSGEVIDIEMNLSVIKGHDDDVQGYTVLLRDITRQRELTQKKDEFISIASHELRTPMTIINGHATILMDGKYGKLNKKQQYYVDRIKKSAIKLIQLVGDMLDISKIESAEDVVLSYEDVSIKKLIHGQIESFADVCKQGKLHLEADIDESLHLNADRKKLEQVITNLISNAVKYTPNGGTITLSVKEEPRNPDYVLFKVQDTGVGIDRKGQQELFHKFSQVDSVLQREAEGTGLGLVIVKEIVEEHGGEVWVESAKNLGSSFIFRIPKDGELI